ncbi:FAD-binding protein [Nocardia africana]|uniref:FAD-binding protein n=1 Tax=Nocardia africana TaxID=134964 RepID=A0ABW6NGK0_9NOCA
MVVIGCGMPGLLTAIRLREAGFPFVVIENAQPLPPHRLLAMDQRTGPGQYESD